MNQAVNKPPQSGLTYEIISGGFKGTVGVLTGTGFAPNTYWIKEVNGDRNLVTSEQIRLYGDHTADLWAVFDEENKTYIGYDLTLSKAESLLCQCQNGEGDCYLVATPSLAFLTTENEYFHCDKNWKVTGSPFRIEHCTKCNQEVSPSRSKDLSTGYTFEHALAQLS